jgi:hypothetical protein
MGQIVGLSLPFKIKDDQVPPVSLDLRAIAALHLVLHKAWCVLEKWEQLVKYARPRSAATTPEGQP